jgi:hypothetical protein
MDQSEEMAFHFSCELLRRQYLHDRSVDDQFKQQIRSVLLWYVLPNFQNHC